MNRKIIKKRISDYVKADTEKFRNRYSEGAKGGEEVGETEGATKAGEAREEEVRRSLKNPSFQVIEATPPRDNRSRR